MWGTVVRWLRLGGWGNEVWVGMEFYVWGFFYNLKWESQFSALFCKVKVLFPFWFWFGLVLLVLVSKKLLHIYQSMINIASVPLFIQCGCTINIIKNWNFFSRMPVFGMAAMPLLSRDVGFFSYHSMKLGRKFANLPFFSLSINKFAFV